MQQALSAWQDLNESTELSDFHYAALVDFAHFSFSNDVVDDRDSFLSCQWISRGNVDCTVVFDFDLNARLFSDAADNFTARTDNFTDFFWFDFDSFDTWSKFRDLTTRNFHYFFHFIQDVVTTFFSLCQSLVHNFE
ncbi:hypothetical protein D3C72_1525040 [compost metagenome]